jgi:hypothetical protein
MAKTPITRDQLARFLNNDPESIRAFEKLFTQVDTLANTDIVTITQALEDLGLSQGAKDALIEQVGGNIHKVDGVEFNVNQNIARQLGQARWNKTFQTLDLAMDSGVTQPIGQATYARVNNNTGSSIAKGAAVGFSGVATNALQVTPYLANGSTSSLTILGVMGHTLASGATNGYVVTWGFVDGIDTSAFTAGQILYCSTTVAGGLTATKPSSPNNIIPIAVCVVSSATVGVIFVRPTIDNAKSYGIFNKTTDQTPAAINTEYLLTFDNAEIGSGVSIGSPTSRIVVANTGSYEIEAVVQLTSTSASAKNIWVWFKKNGTAIADSARIVTNNINNGYLQSSIHKHVQLSANDYIEVAFASDSLAVTVDNVAATAFAPAAPAAILSVSEI